MLHHIILRAQNEDSLQLRPKKVLFNAYEAVFAEHGLDTNQDRACLRVLLQLGGPDIPGANLYERFEHLLAQLDIKLDFTDDQVSVALSQGVAIEDDPEKKAIFDTTSPHALFRRPERRNSFTSMYDVTAEIERRSKRRALSRASASRVEDGNSPLRKIPSRQGSVDRVFRRHLQSHELAWHGQALQRGRLSVNKEILDDEISADLGRMAPDSALDDENGYERTEDSFTLGEGPIHAASAEHSFHPFIPVSGTQLVRDSGAFDQGRIRILAKRYLRKWIAKTRLRLSHYQGLEVKAREKDSRTLKKQAFDTWRRFFLESQQKQREKQQAEQREHLYEAQARRVRKNYESHLLVKAFTHWKETALDARVKTEAARRKYLSVKYFNVWQRFTVANEVKVEQQILKKPFRKLRKKTALYYEAQVDALQLYHARLTKYIFWRWLLAYALERACRLRMDFEKRRTLSTWNAKLKDQSHQNSNAAKLYVQNLQRRILQAWAAKSRLGLVDERTADAFRMRKMLKRCVGLWQVETVFSPLEDRVSRMKDWRIGRSSFSTWLLRTRMTFRADAVNTLRTNRNAFTAWNDRLRQNFVQALTNDRLLGEALYKWVIAQREILMTRIRQDREKRSVFRRLIAGFREQWSRLQIQEARIQKTRDVRLSISTLECWKLQVTLESERGRMALEFYAPKVEQDMLANWQLRIEHVRKLEKWAKDANFYFAATKTLKVWRIAAAESRKRRTNLAYKKVRKDVKIGLARRVLRTWRSRLHNTRSLEDHVMETLRTKRNNYAHALLFHWQDETLQRLQALADASARHDHRMLSRALRAWIEGSKQVENLKIRAARFHQIRVADVCSAQVRRVSMRAFEAKRRHQDADAMRERHWSKHFRNIFRHWSARSKEVTFQALIQNPSPSAEQEPTDAGYGTASQDDPPHPGAGTFGAAQRAEEWTAFDTALFDRADWIPPSDGPPQETSTPMPTPGYLNTPSKRAARAKALANILMTPATPLGTPFAAKLRAGMATSTNAGRISTPGRGGVGQSALRRNARLGEVGEGHIDYEGKNS